MPGKCFHHLSALVRSQIQKICQEGGKNSENQNNDSTARATHCLRTSLPSIHTSSKSPQMLWICNITFVLKGAEAQNPRTLFSARKKHKGSKTPHVKSYCGEEPEQQCWSLKSPAEGTAQHVELPDVSLTRGCHRARADPRGSFSTEMAETTALNMGLLLQPQHLQKQHQPNPLHLVLAISVCLRFSGLGFFFCEVVFRFGLGSSEQ